MNAMRRRLVARKGGGPESGAAAVEFALLLPLLLLILFGIIDFGRYLNMQIAFTQASREGVRGLAIGTSSDPTNVVKAAAAPITGESVAYTTCPATPTATTPPATVTVTKTFTWSPPLAAIANFFGGSLAAPTVTGKAQMRCGG